MREYSQSQKVISTLIIFIVLSGHLGCSSSRIVATYDLPSYSTRYCYVLHSERMNYLLEKKSIISNETLYGKIKQTFSDSTDYVSNKVHLYLFSDTGIKIDYGIYLRVPLREVKKAELHQMNKYARRAIIVIPATCLGIGLLYLLGVDLLESIIDFLFREP